MYKIDFNHPCHIYFIGIGGISMSGLAEILLEEGFQVSGSDIKPSPLTESLEKNNARVFYGQKASNLSGNVDVVVYTSAIHEDNPEFIAMKERQLPCLTRAELLGQMMQNYKVPVAVSGTHGKTTTTSMISSILLKAGLDPTLSIGGILKEIGGNIRIGKSEYFVTEACEYTNSFLSFFPKIGIILNIEEDHLDFFRDLDDIRHSFRRFAELIPEDGLLIINRDIPRYEEITEGLSCRVITFGSNPESHYRCFDLSFDHLAHAAFQVEDMNGSISSFRLNVPGEHNVSNAMAALALADYLHIPAGVIQKGLLAFTGTDRRFQYKGQVNGFTIIDDYAHHPTEIQATLKAAARYPHREIWCVFQPHTYSRTKAFLPEFAKALSLADHVILADIYAARETDTLGISSQTLAGELEKLGADVHYFPSFDEIEKFLLKKCLHGDLCITMGAGNVINIGEDLLRQ